MTHWSSFPAHIPDAAPEEAADVAARLNEVSNPTRLKAMCHLWRRDVDGGEATVGHLQEVTGSSQSALSQHLARLRAAGLVATRRQGQNIYYRLADDDARDLMDALCGNLCGTRKRDA